MNKALILVDLQNEWLNKNSEYYLKELPISKINTLIDFCRDKSYKIIFIKHLELNGEYFKEGTKNAEIISKIKKKDTDTLITKNKISPFYKTDLDKELKSIDEIIVCGALTNLCVRSLIQDAYDRDFKITVIRDCCKTMNEKTQEFTLKDLKETREEIQIIELEDLSE